MKKLNGLIPMMSILSLLFLRTGLWRFVSAVNAADQAELARKVVRLEPLICVKG